mgnify:CR=1 FL=1
MQVGELLEELYGRIEPLVEAAVEGLDVGQLTWAPGPGANTIAWLVWHLTRVQDHHVAELIGEPQIWVTGAWPSRFGLDADPSNTGYGHRPEDVVAVRPDDAAAMTGYLHAVAERTRGMLRGVKPDDLDCIVDERWDPPVTLGVRLVSIADDDLQHAGQAAYLRGLLPGR